MTRLLTVLAALMRQILALWAAGAPRRKARRLDAERQEIRDAATSMDASRLARLLDRLRTRRPIRP